MSTSPPHSRAHTPLAEGKDPPLSTCFLGAAQPQWNLSCFKSPWGNYWLCYWGLGRGKRRLSMDVFHWTKDSPNLAGSLEAPSPLRYKFHSVLMALRLHKDEAALHQPNKGLAVEGKVLPFSLPSPTLMPKSCTKDQTNSRCLQR